MLEFSIPTMTCSHCVVAVTNAIQQADPLAKVEIDLATHQVRVETAEGRETMVAALGEAGYAPG